MKNLIQKILGRKTNKQQNEESCCPTQKTETEKSTVSAETEANKARLIAEEIKRQTACPCFKLHLDKKRKPRLTDCKLGGIPYWEPGKDYPTGRNGEKLMLLAQINFSQQPTIAPLPEKGLLQFFIARDEENCCYGVNYADYTIQEDFRIIYHPEIDESITEEQVKALGIPVCNDLNSAPTDREYALNIQPGISFANPNLCTFDYHFALAVEKLFGEKFEGKWVDYFTHNKAIDTINWLLLDEEQFQMLGYHSTTQNDPVEGHERHYDTLLLQIPTIEAEENDVTQSAYNILWGDCGIANFFINSEALKRHDFNNVWYNWDCY